MGGGRGKGGGQTLSFSLSVTRVLRNSEASSGLEKGRVWWKERKKRSRVCVCACVCA